ncbi:hypothetical protein SKAU_G00033180 [Synaphobranchus kaupii]|uniref:Uncharacterized protein n=1 Tax=Synaphobranchus kaupii TaxID=118154 RepID=A0A9Q1GFE9_SYNKA|nr:hypothetical protein SKAU_G00033180 [Synaphobranchus kaupii]
MMSVALDFYLGVSLLCLLSAVNCTVATKDLSIGSIPNSLHSNSYGHEESPALHSSSNPNADKPAHSGSSTVAGIADPSTSNAVLMTSWHSEGLCC